MLYEGRSLLGSSLLLSDPLWLVDSLMLSEVLSEVLMLPDSLVLPEPLPE